MVRALDLITVVVPPALPATLAIGTSFAISRLRKAGIFCISPSRVNVAGKVNVCCFDKTGTLTEDGLDILGVRGLDRNVQRFGELLENVHDLPSGKGKALFLHALATCHSLKMVSGEAIGDPLDVKMFGFTRWTLEEGRVGGTGVIKTKSGAVVEQAALVQTVVRPPGSAQFKLEDALKGSAKVSLSCRPDRAFQVTRRMIACAFFGIGSHPHVRFCFLIAAHECCSQATEEHKYGDLCQRGA